MFMEEDLLIAHLFWKEAGHKKAGWDGLAKTETLSQKMTDHFFLLPH